MRGAVAPLAAIGGLLLFLFLADVPERSRFWSAFFNAGHTALFGVIAVLVRRLLARWSRLPETLRTSPVRLGLLAFGLTVVLGAATELLQMLQRGADPSIADLLRDIAGAGAFLLGACGLFGASPAPGRRLAALLGALAFLVPAGWTLAWTSAAYIARDRAFPTLFCLEGAWWEREFIRLERNELTPGVAPPAGMGILPGPLARLDLRPARYSGVAFEEPYPDWSGARRFVMTIVSDLDVDLPMTIRVHDAAHDRRYADRFNRRVTVHPGVNRLVIPIDRIRAAPDRREMDLRRIRGILLFTQDLKRRTHVYLGPLVLE